MTPSGQSVTYLKDFATSSPETSILVRVACVIHQTDNCTTYRTVTSSSFYLL